MIIETIARALCAEAFAYLRNENDAEWQNIIDDRWPQYLSPARAVAEALNTNHKGVVTVVAEWADRIKNGRTHREILDSIRDETDELDEEIAKMEKGEPEGADGVFGEAVDIMVSTLDILREARPNTPLDELEREVAVYADIKCQKWARKYG